MVTLAATTKSIDNEEVRRFLADCRRSDMDDLRRRIERGVADGDVLPGTDAAMLAQFVAAVLHGMCPAP